jgi:hypothetical protein
MGLMRANHDCFLSKIPLSPRLNPSPSECAFHMIEQLNERSERRMDNQFFKNVEKKTGVKMNDVFALANSLQNANFKDEKTVRGIIQRVSQIANKKVPKDLENKIVQSIVQDGKKLDFNTISKMMNNGK